MKSEYQKMIAGELYSPLDFELRKLAKESRKKQNEFNQEDDESKSV